MEMNTETHLFIIWHSSIAFKNSIISELKEKFLIKRIFKVFWEEKYFLDNLKVFYSHSQKHLSNEQYDLLLRTKIEQCGTGYFYLIVFDDTDPFYEDRITSSGLKKVNTRIFDLKTKYRELAGNFRVHSSDDLFESNKDLSVLLGKNILDFQKFYPGSSEDELVIRINCPGVGGFKNITSLFYLLNNSIKYVVLRNFECIPEEYTVEGHGDIDLLVEDINYIKYLTGAKDVYPDQKFRVYNEIKIGSELVPFDFRYIGDGYYDLRWQISILENRILEKGIFYIPNPTNYFYTLLYHAYVQKPEVKKDYHSKLKKIGSLASISYDENTNANLVTDMLDNFLLKENYSYTYPEDTTVFVNTNFLVDSRLFKENYGRMISKSPCSYVGKKYYSQVFKKGEIITKLASKEIIKNEIKYLEILKKYSFFPRIISHHLGKNYGVLKIEWIDHITIEKLREEKSFWTSRNLKKFLNTAITILEILNTKGIMHRDIRPENILVGKEGDAYNLYLIDFGWATDFIQDENPITPWGMGGPYHFNLNEFSDAHTVGKIFKKYLNDFPTIINVCKELEKITPRMYNEYLVGDKLKKIKSDFLKKGFSLSEKKYLLKRRYPRFKRTVFKLSYLKNKIKVKYRGLLSLLLN